MWRLVRLWLEVLRMININLIPLERRKKGFPVYKIYILGIYVILAITLLLWAYNLVVFKYTESKLKDVQENIVSMHLWQERYELNQLQNADLQKRGLIISNLSKSRMLWSNYLAELGNITPYGCWLVSVNQETNKANIISIEGNALRMEQILTFVNNLQKDPRIASVSLVKTQSSKSAVNANINVIKFKININRNGGQPNAK